MIKKDAERQNYRRSSFKLILMDYEMPEMNGPECTDLIRNFLYQNNIDQPIIAGVTSHTD